MQLEVHLETNDIVAGQQYVRRSLDRAPEWWFILGCVGLGALFAVGLRTTDFDFHYPSAGITLGFLALLWLLFFIQARRRLVPSKRGAVLGPHRITVDDEGIRFSSQHSDAIYRWPTVKKWSVQGNRIFIKIDRLAALVVPTRAFVSEEQKAEFLGELRRHAA